MGKLNSRIGFDEVSECGALFFSGCSPFTPNGFQIEVSEAYDDSNISRNAVLIEIHGGNTGIAFNLSLDEADALASIIRHASKTVRDMTSSLRKQQEEEGLADE